MLKGKLTPTHFLQGTISKTADVVGSNIQPITICKNGTYEASNGVDGFSPIYVDTPEPKEEQEKTVDVIENGTVEVFPDGDTVLSKVTINSNVPDMSEIIEDIIDESGVLDSTEGTVSVMEKVEQLIEKSRGENLWYNWTKLSRSMFDNLFNGFSFTRLPRVSFASASTMVKTFYNMKSVVDIDFYIDSKNCTSLNNTFAETNIKSMVGVDTSSCTDASSMFQNSVVETIEKPFDFSKVTKTSNAFGRSGKLKEVRFVAETINVSIAFNSSILSAESVESIINGLATVTTAQTVTLNSAITLTDEQKLTIKNKGWTLVQ